MNFKRLCELALKEQDINGSNNIGEKVFYDVYTKRTQKVGVEYYANNEVKYKAV